MSVGLGLLVGVVFAEVVGQVGHGEEISLRLLGQPQVDILGFGPDLFVCVSDLQ